MSEEHFWSMIEASRSGGEECEEQVEKLSALLGELQVLEVVEFANVWGRKFKAAYRRDLWAVAYIINAGCSDDAFMDFRGWLIAQGREFFQVALDKPERAADGLSEDDYAGCEEILYCADRVYRTKTGQELSEHPAFAAAPPHPFEPAGEPWQDEDLPGLYPELYARFNS